MSSELPRVLVEWSYTHEATDDPSTIAQHLAAGYDEGPLLIIPDVGLRSGTRRPAEARLFANVMSYERHLREYADEIGVGRNSTWAAPRWAGLVRRNSGDSEADALAALFGLKTLLDSTKKVFHPPKARLRSEQDYEVLEGPYYSEGNILIDNIGEGVSEVMDAFPMLAERMMYSKGLITAVAPEDNWD